MFPRLAMHDAPNTTYTDWVFLCERGQCFSGCVSLANTQYVSGGQLGSVNHAAPYRGTVPRLIRCVIRRAIPAQIVHSIVVPTSVSVAGLQATGSRSDECQEDKLVNKAGLGAIFIAKTDLEITSALWCSLQDSWRFTSTSARGLVPRPDTSKIRNFVKWVLGNLFPGFHCSLQYKTPFANPDCCDTTGTKSVIARLYQVSRCVASLSIAQTQGGVKWQLV
jgi:hypothetical protein